jgi:hypothetical protein
VHVAHRDRGDEIAVEQRRARERERLAADHRRLVRGSQRRGERADLLRFIALPAGDGAREGVEQDVFDPSLLRAAEGIRM